LLAALALAVVPAAASPRANVWERLHRALHLPSVAVGAACPVSRVDHRVRWRRLHIFGTSGTGRGPVYPALGTPPAGYLVMTPDTQYGGPWYGSKVFWYASPRYRGPVLIRGRQLDGDGVLGFNGRASPRRELHLHRGETVGWAGRPLQARGISSTVRALQAGCYGVQIDGTSFSRVVVFQVATQPDG
jgi:hypothetical protein